MISVQKIDAWVVFVFKFLVFFLHFPNFLQYFTFKKELV